MKYLLKLWLSVVLVSPFIVCCLLALSGGKEWINGGTAILLLSLMVFTGLLMSIPAMAVLFFLKAYLQKNNSNPVMVKALICIFAISAIYLNFLVADYSFVFSLANNIWWPAVYCATATAAIFYFKMSPQPGKTATDE